MAGQKAGREDRLAEALRANLRRRKAQAAGRTGDRGRGGGPVERVSGESKDAAGRQVKNGDSSADKKQG